MIWKYFLWAALGVSILVFPGRPTFASTLDRGGGVSVGPETKLALPRFVSLKPKRTNVRYGPSLRYDVAWTFVRADLPVEVTAEFENWRRIRDADGAEGWIYHALLSGRRTALVAPWLRAGTVTLYERASADGSVISELERGVLARLESCDTQWCHVTGRGFDGFVRQSALWGVYPGEKIAGR